MSGARPLVLLVDDDRSVLAGVSGLLRDEGYRTATVETVAAARRCLADERDPPDLVLLDIRIPVESGLDLLRSLPQPLPVPVSCSRARPRSATPWRRSSWARPTSSRSRPRPSAC